MSARKYAALILAAGFSSRMRKGFKPLLLIPFADGRRSALENLAQLYLGAGIQHILVVGGQRQSADIVAETKRLGLAYVQNPHPECGMFSSVSVGLKALGGSSSGCFIHPVDVPLVRLCTLRALLAEAAERPGDILIPVFKDKKGHPAFLPTVHFSTVLGWNGENGLRGALLNLPCHKVSVVDKNILLDMDTDDDYAEVCERARRYCILEPDEAAELLRCLAVGVRGMAHARAVSLVAKSFAIACNTAGHKLDPFLAEAGGLLHDMCKGEAQHELRAGRKLQELGLPAMARLVKEHNDCTLADNAPVTEKELIYLADKYLHGDRIVRLQERFGEKLDLFSEDIEACIAIRGRLSRAEAMESRLHRETGAMPFELARDALKESREDMGVEFSGAPQCAEKYL